VAVVNPSAFNELRKACNTWKDFVLLRYGTSWDSVEELTSGMANHGIKEFRGVIKTCCTVFCLDVFKFAASCLFYLVCKFTLFKLVDKNRLLF
jgi:hypothetical protein